MGTEQLDQTTFYWLMTAVLLLASLAAIGVVMWDNAHEMWAGEEPEQPFGDITSIPWEQQQRLDRARFERMDGVL